MTKPFPTRLAQPTPARVATLALTLSLGACTSTGPGLFSGDRVDYKAGAQRTQPLDVPPDLTQLTRDSRYLPQGGVVSAADLAKGGPAPAATAGTVTARKPEVALNSLGDLRIERLGNQRWIVSPRSPEELWPKLKKFWLDRGFTIESEDAAAGTLETGWAENRAKLPSSFIRDTLGKIVDGLFDSGLRDRYRMRLERGAAGTEIYISHFGAEEVITGAMKDSTQWVPRESDPDLVAEMLAQVMVSLGAADGAARTAVASAGAAASAPAPAGAASAVTVAAAGSVHARAVTGGPGAALQVDDAFDRAWRRVGLALDRAGFTVEDRDRAQGIYFVRFVNDKEAAKDEPGFFSRLWHWGRAPASSAVGKYRIVIKQNAEGSGITVLDDKGVADNSENAQHIVGLLVEGLQ